MRTLPFMYGIIFRSEKDGQGNETFRTFRVGTHGKYEMSGVDALKSFIKETPIDRLMHKMTISDGTIFISDEMYQPDERIVFRYSGYANALLGWKRIIEWAHRSGILNELNIKYTLGTLVFMHDNLLDPLYDVDTFNEVAQDKSFYDSVNCQQETTYIVTDVSLNRLDNDGYPSWRNDSETGKRKKITYSMVVCYTGLEPNIPSFVNNEKDSFEYVYFHAVENTHDPDDLFGALAYLSFYNVTPGNISSIMYMSFACATLLQTPLRTYGLNGQIETVWLDPEIGTPVRVVRQPVTKKFITSLHQKTLK